MEGECRAVGYPNAEGLIAGLTINGETGVSELLHFRFWDADNGVISDYFDLIPVTHAGENLSLDLEFFTPEIMDSQISVVGAEQVQGNSEFQVNLQSYQGVAQSWNINAIEFELHYDTSLVEFASYETAGCLTEGSLVEVSAQGSFVTVSITGEQFMGIDPLMKINFEALAGGGLCLIQLQNFWLEELPGNGYPIFNLLPAEITILPVNMPPVVANPISYLWLEENFETVEIDLSEVFLDPEGEELSYYVYNSFNIGYLEASIDGNFLYIASCPYISGVFQVTVTAEDPQGLIAIDEFYVYINPVNDPPEINLPAEFTFLYSQEVTQDFSNYIFDIDNDDLVLSSEGSDNIAVAINDFLVTLMPASGWTGSESLVFSVSDGMYTASDETLVTFETLPMELTADFYVENTQISLGSSVMFENQSIYPPEAVITYEWDFENDGITDSDEENPLYIYNEPGIYSVSLSWRR
jgi:hypothetical protein